MMDKGRKYLSDILYAINLNETFTKPSIDYNDFVSDIKTRSAIERQLGIIGEAVNNYEKLLPQLSLKNARQIVGFRNRLIHAYDAIDASILWVIIKKYIPSLKEEVLDKISE